MKFGARLKISILVFGSVLCFVAIALSSSLWRWGGCAAISPATAERLAQYIRIKARLPAGAELTLGYAEPVADSCYQAVHFRVKDRPAADFVVFLSPDQRFLSRDLSDWKLDSVLTSGRALPQEQNPPRLSDEEFSELMKLDAPSKGNPEAPIKIALFTDFQCPYCRQQAQILKDQFKKDELYIVFHHLPLKSHDWARTAAELAGCVARQNNEAFWGLFDTLYENQGNLTSNTVRQFVQKSLETGKGLDPKGFDLCVSGSRSAPKVDADLALSAKYRFNATPSMFINGVRKQGVVGPDEIRRLARLSEGLAPENP